MNRREFGKSVTGAASAGIGAQGQADRPPDWGGPIVDCHHHLHPRAEANIVHLNGCGVSNAMALAGVASATTVKEMEEKYPGRFPGWFVSADITKPEAEDVFRTAEKAGAIGFGELEFHVEAADYANDIDYPPGKVKRDRVTDKLLSDCPNPCGDLSANLGNNALSRDPEFTPDFLKRHQNKLICGSDCSCEDGKGCGVSQAGNPNAKRLAGKCFAREKLGLLKRTVSPQMFRKLVRDNAHRGSRLRKA